MEKVKQVWNVVWPWLKRQAADGWDYINTNPKSSVIIAVLVVLLIVK